jgi:hypothetical protein
MSFANQLSERLFGYEVDLSAAFEQNNIDRISLKWVDPYRDRIERIAARRHIASLDPESYCSKALSAEKNLIIHSVIGAKGISYTFESKSGDLIELNAEILSQIGIPASSTRISETEAGISVKGDILLGYRAWIASNAWGASDTTPAGTLGSESLELKELDNEEVAWIRRKSLDGGN